MARVALVGPRSLCWMMVHHLAAKSHGAKIIAIIMAETNDALSFGM